MIINFLKQHTINITTCVWKNSIFICASCGKLSIIVIDFVVEN